MVHMVTNMYFVVTGSWRDCTLSHAIPYKSTEAKGSSTCGAAPEIIPVFITWSFQWNFGFLVNFVTKRTPKDNHNWIRNCLCYCCLTLFRDRNDPGPEVIPDLKFKFVPKLQPNFHIITWISNPCLSVIIKLTFTTSFDLDIIPEYHILLKQSTHLKTS